MKESFSIVMTVYDQASELESNLPAFLTQEYEPGYEVIVVDETSTDNTEDVLKIMKNDYPHLYTTFLPKPNRQVTRRKLAINIGSKAAKNEWIIITKIEHKPIASDILQAIGQVHDQEAKAERKLRKIFNRNQRMSYLWGRYDFIIIPKNCLVRLLGFYEHKITWSQLISIRFGILWQSLIRRSSTTTLVTQ